MLVFEMIRRGCNLVEDNHRVRRRGSGFKLVEFVLRQPLFIFSDAGGNRV